MWCRHATWVLSLILSTVAVLPQARAGTIIVDSQGAGQFTDIPPAIAAAHPGDVLLVLPGSYSGFTLDKGLRVIGYGVAATGAVEVLGVPSGSLAAVVHFVVPSLSVGNCPSPVLLQELSGLESLTVTGSPDVRVWSASIQRPAGPPAPFALTTSSSRLELSESSVRGSDALPCVVHGDGGPAASFASSRVQLARTSVFGGNGSTCTTSGFFAGDGASSIGLDGTQMVISGGGVSFIRGGGGGFSWFYSNCTHDGNGACAIVSQGAASTIWHSGANVFSPPVVLDGGTCLYGNLGPFCGGTHTQVSPEDPTLEVAGTPFAGQSITFTLHARVGSSAILYFGRQAIVVPESNPNVIEQLTPKARIVNLGQIGATGEAQFTWPIAGALEQGTLLIAQAEVTLPGGSLQRTNSIPVLVR